MEINLGDVEDPSYFIRRWRNLLFALTMIYTFTLTSVIVAFVAIYVHRSYAYTKESVNIPESELQYIAACYMKSLDQNTEPCEDFYAFACGNLKHEYEKENQYRFSTLTMMAKHARDSLHDLLIKPMHTSDSATLRQMKIFHQMCVDTAKIEKEGIEPVLAMLNEIGGWPLLTTDWEKNESWEEIVGSVNRAGFATFFPYFLDIARHPNNSFRSIIKMEPFLSTSRPRVLRMNKRVIQYVKVVALFLNAKNDLLEYDIKDFIDFETELYRVTYSSIPTRRMLTYKSLLVHYRKVPWKSFFHNMLVSTGIKLSNDEPIFVHSAAYNFRVTKLLKETPALIIRNYIVWRLIIEAIPFMPQEFRVLKNAFEMRTGGQSRSLDCLDTLISKAKVSTGYLYIKNYIDRLARNKSNDMIKNIKSEAYEFLKNMSWMDSGTSKKVIETLRYWKTTVPHPDDNIDVMESLDFRSSDTTLANYRRLVKAHHNLEYSKLKMSEKVYQRVIPYEYALMPDAWYFPTKNASFILPAIFQRPLFSTSQPMYLNYGGIGFMMAHEMTHGLKVLSACKNNECPSFDRLQEKKECVKKLYDDYVFKQLNIRVQGNATLEENIGDLIGLKLTYRAYEKFAKDSKEQLLPGLNYTARQWFWINAATICCSFENDKAFEDTLMNDMHSAPEARVNVAFANTEEFSRDFQCPIGSPMNPTLKCGFEDSKQSSHSSYPHTDEF